MDGTCELAARGELKAFLVPQGSEGGDLYIVATGTTSTPCWDVEVDLSPIDIWPPQYVIIACPTSPVCPQLVSPYSAIGRFPVTTRPETIKVQDAEGVQDVPVEVVPDLAARGASSDGSVIGWSRAIELEEAIAHAAAQLPRAHPNVGVNMKVEEIWYTDGGIVGPMLYVKGRPKT